MNINPSAAASLAGTGRAAAKGGEADGQAIENSRQQSRADKPGGKSSQSSEIDAGDQTGDRGGNGRQVLDRFERSDSSEEQLAEGSAPGSCPSTGSSGQNLDLEA